MIKACIFDLDGTLADTLDSMAYVTNIIMEKIGLKHFRWIISDITAEKGQIC